MSDRRGPVIAVVGASMCPKKLQDRAGEVGRYVAEHGGTIVCGGMGGIMEGSARGAKEAGGTTIGILPGIDSSAANEFIDIVIPTGFGEARNIIIVRTADAIIAFPGKYGTLTEMAFALQARKPVISVGAWELGDEVHHVETAREAAELAMELARGKT